MAVTAHWFPKGLQLAMNKEIDWDTDTVRLALLDNTYSFLDTHDYFNDVSGDEVVGTGYTADGEALTTKSVTFTQDTGATAWAASTAYVEGDIVRPGSANGHLYMCIVAGTSDTSEPTFPTTLRATVTDSTVTWAEVGETVVIFDADNVTWSSSTITARYGVVYVDTGTASTSPLIALIDFGQDESSSSGDFTVSFSGNGIVRLFRAFAISS